MDGAGGGGGFETLGAIAIEFGADLSSVDRALDGALPHAQSRGQGIGSAFSLGFTSRAMNAIGGIRQFKDGLTEIGTAAYEVSGVGIASKYQSLEVGFTGILKSAKGAKDLMGELSGLGMETPFDTAELTGNARGLLGVGVAAQSVTRDLRAMADATATPGGGTADLNGLSENLGQIRVSTNPDLEDLKQLLRRGINLDRVVGAAQGKTLGEGEGVRALKGMNGREAYDTLIKGFEKEFAGAAKAQAGSTLAGVGQGLGEQIGLAMKPTGDALLPILQEVGVGLQGAAAAFGQVNDVTGGSAGLIGIVTVGVFALKRWGGGMVEAFGATKALTMAVGEYAATARAASVVGGTGPVGTIRAAEMGEAVTAARVGEAATAAKGGATALQAGEGAVGLARGAQNVARVGEGASEAAGLARALGMVGRVAGVGAKIGAGVVALAPLAIDIGANYVGDKIKNAKGAGGLQKEIGAGVAGAGTGAGIGALIGSFVPVIGTAIGGAVGAVVGAGIGFYRENRRQVGEADNAKKAAGDAKAGGTAADRTATATEKMSKTLEDMKGKLIGGGERTRGMVGRLEAEYAFHRMIRTGVG